MDLDPTGFDVHPISKGVEKPMLSSPCVENSARPCKRPRLRACIRPGERVYPESAYVGSKAHTRAISAKPESEVLSTFLAEETMEDSDEGGYFISYVLDEFVIYRAPDVKPLCEEIAEGRKLIAMSMERHHKGQGEFELPSAVHVECNVKSLVFDGILKSGDKEEMLYCIPFDILSIGNLATPSEHNIDKQIWIQSHCGAQSQVPGGVWYELGRPAKEYTKHWETFEWLALFVKYVSDAIEICVQRNEKVTLKYFRHDFASQMRQMHGEDPVFRKWMASFGKDDFRIPIATHVEFLWAQLQTVGSKEQPITEHLTQPIWGEILPTGLTAIPPAHPPGQTRDRCVVTAYVGSLFEWIFGKGIEIIDPDSGLHTCEGRNVSDADSRDLHVPNSKQTQLATYYTFHHKEYHAAVYPRFTTCTTGAVTTGDVVELQTDEETLWKKPSRKRYAFVTDTSESVDKLRILWLYWPEDLALCMSMRYPYSNELFFSDHCACAKTILAKEVVKKVAVEFFCIDGKLKDPNAEFFVRQKYFSDSNNVYVACLTPQDILPMTQCPCRSVKTHLILRPGEFVLVEEQDRLQPYRFEGGQEKQARLRKMERRREVEGVGKPNELVWTEKIVDVSVTRLVRRCRVVRAQDVEKIPRLADWNSSSDWFFYQKCIELNGSIGKCTNPSAEPHYADNHEKANSISHGCDRFTQKFGCLPLTSFQEQNIKESTTTFQSNISEGIIGTAVMDINLNDIPEERKLRGLDLFCGGGNFGRGVADGGAVHHKWAVDVDVEAMHTYRANLEHEDVNLYLGSINNFLFDVITGRDQHLPHQGDIELILAGSPCLGFSNANPLGHEALNGYSNPALICSAVSAIDYYRPRYAILENVPAMAATRKSGCQDVNVSNQIMCALIGMGYQCRCLLLDAWHFGAPQSRTRLFIEIAAPGCVLPEIPPGSHAHPQDIKNSFADQTPTDLAFSRRDFDALTTFPSIKLKDTWDDLPNIGNGHLGVCIPYPDHKTYWTANTRDRQLAAYIPRSDSLISAYNSRYPGYKYALRQGMIPEELKLSPLPPGARDERFSRLCAEGLLPALTCALAPQSSVSGRVIHYLHDRVISNMEAKRAQGFLDMDVLVGRPKKAFEIIGNSVCRQVALALGERLAEAVRKGLAEPEKMENGTSGEKS